MITFYMVSICENRSNSSQTRAAESHRRFLSSLTNVRALLCRPVSERIWNRGEPSCETLVFSESCILDLANFHGDGRFEEALLGGAPARRPSDECVLTSLYTSMQDKVSQV
jgi:hypothetical protein